VPPTPSAKSAATTSPTVEHEVIGRFGLARPNGLLTMIAFHADGRVMLVTRLGEEEATQELGRLRGPAEAQAILDIMDALAHLPPDQMTYS